MKILYVSLARFGGTTRALPQTLAPIEHTAASRAKTASQLRRDHAANVGMYKASACSRQPRSDAVSRW